MLETLREYAFEQIAARAMRGEHAVRTPPYCIVLAEEGNPYLWPLNVRTGWRATTWKTTTSAPRSTGWLRPRNSDWAFRLGLALYGSGSGAST